MPNYGYNHRVGTEATHRCAALNVYIAFNGDEWCWIDQEQCPSCGNGEPLNFTLVKRTHTLFLICDACKDEFLVTEV